MSPTPITSRSAARLSPHWKPSPQLTSSLSAVEVVTNGCLPLAHAMGEPPTHSITPVTDL